MTTMKDTITPQPRFWDGRGRPRVLTPEQIADALAESREYLEQHGWVRGILRAPDDKVCAVGAIVYSQNWNDTVNTIALQQCIDAVMKVAPMEGRMRHQTLQDWNDDPVTDMQQVVDAFAKAEKVVRAGFDPDA